VISREQLIFAEVLIRLLGAPLGPIPMPAGLTVDRYRLREIRPETLPHISLYPITADPRNTGGGTEETVEIKLPLFAKPGATETVDQALDPLWLWANQQLLTDQSLGGLALRIAPSPRIWSANLAQAPFGDLDCHFLITYRHSAADPTRP
jgi:hypothetical protein